LTAYHGKVVCGVYKVSDKWGVSVGSQRFIYKATVLVSPAGNDDWDVFCSEDPANALYVKTGINVAVLSTESLARIRQDFADLEVAMGKKNPKDVDMPNDPWGNPYQYIEPWFGGIRGDVKLRTLGADGAEGGKDENADIGNWQITYIDHIENL
jgi:hypothetical protein